MPRIRSIKPEFFINEELALLTPWARLLFIGLWTAADREGRMQDRPKRIKTQVFPYDDVDIEALLSELERHEFIQRYTAGNIRCLQVITFCKHQKPHPKEAPSTIPAPDGSREKVLLSREEVMPSRVVNGSRNGSGYGSGNGVPLPRAPGSDDEIDDVSKRYAIEELETGALFVACSLPDVLLDLFPDLPFPEFYRKWWLSRCAKGGIGRRAGAKATLRQYCADIEGFFGNCNERRKQDKTNGGKPRYETASERNVRNISQSLDYLNGVSESGGEDNPEVETLLLTTSLEH